jgi:hypothetical protein
VKRASGISLVPRPVFETCPDWVPAIDDVLLCTHKLHVFNDLCGSKGHRSRLQKELNRPQMPVEASCYLGAKKTSEAPYRGPGLGIGRWLGIWRRYVREALGVLIVYRVTDDIGISVPALGVPGIARPVPALRRSGVT